MIQFSRGREGHLPERLGRNTRVVWIKDGRQAHEFPETIDRLLLFIPVDLIFAVAVPFVIFQYIVEGNIQLIGNSPGRIERRRVRINRPAGDAVGEPINAGKILALVSAERICGADKRAGDVHPADHVAGVDKIHDAGRVAQVFGHQCINHPIRDNQFPVWHPKIILLHVERNAVLDPPQIRKLIKMELRIRHENLQMIQRKLKLPPCPPPFPRVGRIIRRE